MANEAMASPSSTRYGSWRSSARSLNVPGSPSAALQTANRRPGPASRMPVHFRPVGKPPPPRPRKPDGRDLVDDGVLADLHRSRERLAASAPLVLGQRADRLTIQQHRLHASEGTAVRRARRLPTSVVDLVRYANVSTADVGWSGQEGAEGAAAAHAALLAGRREAVDAGVREVVGVGLGEGAEEVAGALDLAAADRRASASSSRPRCGWTRRAAASWNARSGAGSPAAVASRSSRNVGTARSRRARAASPVPVVVRSSSGSVAAAA